jgi:hypothetical protein
MPDAPIAAGPNDVTVRAAIDAGIAVMVGDMAALADAPTWEELQRFADLITAAERGACKEACRKIAAQYPTDIWPEDGETLDCKSARMARLTAANCEREIDMRSTSQVTGWPGTK